MAKQAGLGMQDVVAHSPFQDALLANIWRTYNTVTEAAVTVGFRSSIMDLLQLREAQAGELLMSKEAMAQAREEATQLEQTLTFLTGTLPPTPNP